MSQAAVDVVVDLSNACRDPSLGPSDWVASWARLQRLLAWWSRHCGRSATSALLVADTNLHGLMDRQDQSKLEAGRRTGSVLVSDDADAMMIERAATWKVPLLTCDGLVDHTRNPALQELQVYRWTVAGAALSFERRDLSKPLSAVITRRALRQDVKVRGLSESSPALARHRECENQACTTTFVLVPSVRSGAPTCPQCGGYLADVGPWKAARIVKVMSEATQRQALLLEDGDQRIVGSEPGIDVLDLSPLIPQPQPISTLATAGCSMRKEASPTPAWPASHP